MAESIELTKTFQERLFERIRTSIGEVMSDDDLKLLVDAATQKAFFEPRVIHGDYGRRETRPPELVEKIGDLLKERIDAALTAWLGEHKAEVETIIQEVLSKGIVRIVAEQIDARMRGPLTTLQNDLIGKGIL